MNEFSSPPIAGGTVSRGIALMQRKPVRISVTVHWSLHQKLQSRADIEGRSLSNLVSHLLEGAV